MWSAHGREIIESELERLGGPERLPEWGFMGAAERAMLRAMWAEVRRNRDRRTNHPHPVSRVDPPPER